MNSEPRKAVLDPIDYSDGPSLLAAELAINPDEFDTEDVVRRMMNLQFGLPGGLLYFEKSKDRLEWETQKGTEYYPPINGENTMDLTTEEMHVADLLLGTLNLLNVKFRNNLFAVTFILRPQPINHSLQKITINLVNPHNRYWPDDNNSMSFIREI